MRPFKQWYFKKVTNIINPIIVTNSTAYTIWYTNPTSQDISRQGMSKEMHFIALINWEKQFNAAIYFRTFDPTLNCWPHICNPVRCKIM
jgi:hypothetical protein